MHLKRSTYSEMSLSTFLGGGVVSTNSESLVVTDFSVTVVQIKKNPNKKNVVHTTLCTTWARTTTTQKNTPFFSGGYQSSSVITYNVPRGKTTSVVFSK